MKFPDASIISRVKVETVGDFDIWMIRAGHDPAGEIDEERLARALPFGAIGADEYNEPDDYYRECAAAIAKAYREDTDAHD